MATETLITTVNVANLNSVRWGVMRQLFPHYADDVELGRFIRRLLRDQPNVAVRVEPHRLEDGSISTQLFDVYRLDTQSE